MKTKIKNGNIDLFVVAPGVWGMKDIFVNLYIINNPSENNWWLVDAGVSWSGSKIKGMAEILFGAASRPAAIILTHGHFDHIGSVKKLAEEWNIPVYAHPLEMPYLTGLSSYPPADPGAGGGLMADLSFLYPKKPINISNRIVSLPQGGTIPGLPEWKYLHTPGHAPGHISLFRESDKVLISGDAVVTTKPESALSTMFQLKKLSGPPKYFTSDWLSAASSVEHLANLEPEIIASGHGRPLRGESMRKSLHNLVLDFQKTSVPVNGRYSYQPALMDDSGVVHIPPKNLNASTAPTLKILGISAAVLLTVLLFKKSKKKSNKKNTEELKSKVNRYESNHKNLKNILKADAKKIKGPAEDEISKFKSNFIKKSKAVAKKIEKKVEEVKEPALEMLDNMKFKVKKRVK